jgi:hypothetical protein
LRRRMRVRRLQDDSIRVARRRQVSILCLMWRSRPRQKHRTARTCCMGVRNSLAEVEAAATCLYDLTMLHHYTPKQGYRLRDQGGGGSRGCVQAHFCTRIRTGAMRQQRCRSCELFATFLAGRHHSLPSLRIDQQAAGHSSPPPIPDDQFPHHQGAIPATMLLLDYQNVLIESLLKDRVNGCELPRDSPCSR